MNVLIFTDTDAQKLVAHQSGQHRLAPIQLTDGRWFLMEDILTEMPEGIYKDKLKDINYTLQSFEDIQDLMFVTEDVI